MKASKLIKVVPYGVLGTVLTRDRRIERIAKAPGSKTVIVDPAGLPYIRSKPRGAGGASGSIYEFLHLNLDAPFPKEVQTAIKQEGDAAFWDYGGHPVIHVVGTNFNSSACSTAGEASELLATSYFNVLSLFHESGHKYLRLLPISSGIFSGSFGPEMPTITASALQAALGELPAQTKKFLQRPTTKVDLCIFAAAEVPAYQAAMDARKTTKL